jgi:hypothetical protein
MTGPDWFLITAVYLSGFLSGWLMKGCGETSPATAGVLDSNK